jgi:hypothetical protein
MIFDTMLAKVARAISAIWTRDVPPPEVPAVPAVAELIEDEDEALPTTAATHIGDILDSIDDYMHWIGRLRAVDPTSYALFARIGGAIMPTTKKAALSMELDPRAPSDPNDWPGFFMMSMPSAFDSPDRIAPKLIYFQKMSFSDTCGADIVPFEGIIYEGTLFFCERGKRRLYPSRFYIGIGEDRKPRLLRQTSSSVQTIPLKRRRKGEPEAVTLHHNRTAYPRPIVEHAKEHKMPASDFAAQLFYMTMSGVIGAFGGVQIAVRQKSLVGRFGIPVERTAYFFKDRDLQVTVNGRRKKIFHAVRAHTRTMESGKRVSVKSHYRGVRNFDWKGYQVHISVLNHHHRPIEDFAAETREFGPDEVAGPGWMDQSETGETLRDYMWNA